MTVAYAKTKKRKRLTRRTANILREHLETAYDTNQARVMAASLIVYLAAQQEIDPDTLTDTEALAVVSSLAALAIKSRGVEGLELSAAVGDSSLGRRWREIRLKALGDLF